MQELYGDVLQVPVLLQLDPQDAAIRVDRMSCLDEFASTIATWFTGSIEAIAADPWLACRDELTSSGRDRLFWRSSQATAVRTRHWMLRQPRVGPSELYVKPDDRYEVSDVADRLPAVTESLRELVTAWEADPTETSSAFTSPLPPPPGAA